MATVATLLVNLDADGARFIAELQKGSRQTKRFSAETRRNIDAAAKTFAAFSAAAVASLTALTKQSFSAIDALAKTADKLGTTTEALGGLQLAGRVTGVEISKLNLGLQRATRRIAEAAQGTGEAQNALKELGLDAKELVKLPIDQQFLKLSEAFENVSNQADKVRLGFKLFDSEGVDLIRTMGIGTEALQGFVAEARQINFAVSRIDASKVEAANDAATRASAAFSGLGNTIAVTVAPFVEQMALQFVEAAKESNGFRDQVQRSFEAAIRVIGVFQDGIRGIKIVFQGVVIAVRFGFQSIIQAIDLVTEGVLALANTVVQGLIAPLRLAADAAGRFSEKAAEVSEALASIEGFSKPQGLEDLARLLADQNTEAIARLQALLLEPLPSTALRERLVEITAAAEAAAQSVAKVKASQEAIAASAASTAAAGAAFATPAAKSTEQLVAEATQKAQAVADAELAVRKQLQEQIIAGEIVQNEQLVELARQLATAKAEAAFAAEQAVKAAAGKPLENLDPLEREQAIAEGTIEIYRDLAQTLVEIDRRTSEQRKKLTEQTEGYIRQQRENTVRLSIGFLQSLAGESKIAAIAAIALEKGLAIAQAIMNTAVAVTKALAIDPTGTLAARVKVLGAAQVALIAATGLAQAAAVGGGGAALGTPGNPVQTTPAAASAERTEGFQDRGSVEIHFHGEVIGWDEHIQTRVIDGIREAIDNRDVVIIGGDSRQASEITRGGG